MDEKSPQVREQELLEERAELIADAIKSNPKLVAAIKEGYEAAERGEGVPAREYLKKRGRRTV